MNTPVTSGLACPHCGSRYYYAHDAYDRCAQCTAIYYPRVEPTDPPALPSGRDDDDGDLAP